MKSLPLEIFPVKININITNISNLLTQNNPPVILVVL